MIESSHTETASTNLKYGMVGGGEGAFIGEVHRKAINMDGMADLVSGCFSSDPENTLRTGLGLGLNPARLYKNYEEMAVEDYRTYLGSLLALKPDLPTAVTDSGHSFMLVLHIFFANLFLIFFPFSQSMHAFLSLPINKLRRG